jgi:hypothetical protein
MNDPALIDIKAIKDIGVVTVWFSSAANKGVKFRGPHKTTKEKRIEYSAVNPTAIKDSRSIRKLNPPTRNNSIIRSLE